MAKQVSLEILRILEEQTDSEHMLSKKEILDELSNRFATYIEEGAFYRKIEELEAAGYKIIHTRGRTTKYCLDIPRLTKDELLYLSMMIAGSPDISTAEANKMIMTLSAMPVHRCAVLHFDKYKKQLESNNSATNQIKKFSTIVSAIENQKGITCKCVRFVEGEYEFSNMKVLYPQSFRYDGKDCVVECLEDEMPVSYFLRALINVEAE